MAVKDIDAFLENFDEREAYKKYVKKQKEKHKSYLTFEDWLRKKNFASGGAAIIGGGALVGASRNALVGKKTMYHGTSRKAWENGIKQNGLRTDFGGKGGAGDAIMGSNSELGSHLNNASKNFVLATRFNTIANKYANIQDDPERFGKAYQDKTLRDKAVQYFRPGGKNGKVIKIDMDYDKFKMGEHDPDSKFIGRPVEEFGEFGKNVAVRTPYDITPEEIAGSDATFKQRFDHNKENFKSYAKNNKGRLAVGAAGTAAGIGLATYGGYKLYKHLKKKKKEKQLIANENYLLSYLENLYSYLSDDTLYKYEQMYNEELFEKDEFSLSIEEDLNVIKFLDSIHDYKGAQYVFDKIDF